LVKKTAAQLPRTFGVAMPAWQNGLNLCMEEM
jgi:hypothetical protein